MPIIAIAESLSKKVFDSREALADAVLGDLLEECPFLAEANASTLRNMVSIILNYNKVADDYGRPYRMLVASKGLTGSAVPNSTFTFKCFGRDLTLVAHTGDHVLKTCPTCSLTACIGDPVCPNCNHRYLHADKEDQVIAAAIAALGGMSSLAAANSLVDSVQVTAANAVVLDDAVEGFKVTEGDIDRQMKDVHKYMPGYKGS